MTPDRIAKPIRASIVYRNGWYELWFTHKGIGFYFGHRKKLSTVCDMACWHLSQWVTCVIYKNKRKGQSGWYVWDYMLSKRVYERDNNEGK